jgi:antitoxin MazE
MLVSLVRIGNSKGVRLPQSVIETCGLGDRIDLRVEDGRVVLSAAAGSREGWDKAFKAMAAAGDDRLLDPETAVESFDDHEWTW